MYRAKRAIFFLSLLATSLYLPAQDNSDQAKQAEQKDVDPLALDVLKAVVQPIEQAKDFSFKALVGEEELASNGQIITFFHTVDVSVERPDKVRLIFRGRGPRVDFYGVSGTVTMYSPEAKVYAAFPAKPTIDATLSDAAEKGIDIPIGPFLRSDIYDLAAKTVTSGYVIGRVKIYDQEVHQLAFTAPDADYQLWVTGGENPRIVRAEIVNKLLEGKPRTEIQFLDWNLAPSFSSDEFTFVKPADASETKILPVAGGK